MYQFHPLSSVWVMVIVLFYTSNYTAKTRVARDLKNESHIDVADDEEQPPVIEDADDVCTTPACKKAASRILENMDRDVNPCEDFYSFACGGFLQKTNLPDDRMIVNAFTVINDSIQTQLRTSLEDPISSNETKLSKNVKSFYKSCMNTTAIEMRGLEPFKEVLKKLGGWPVLEGEKWNKTDFSWMGSVYKFRKLGYPVGYFLSFGFTPDPNNSSKKMLELDEVSFRSENNYLISQLRDDMDTPVQTDLLKDPLIKAYHDYVVDIAMMLGAPKNKSTEIELLQILNFQRSLSKLLLPTDQRRNVTLLNNPMTIANLSKQYPSIPWIEYFNNILAPEMKVDDNEIVIVRVPSYISKLVTLLGNTSKRVQANYVMWKAIEHSIPFLTENIQERQLQWVAQSSGTTQHEPRWKICVGKVSIFPSVQSLYVQKYFNPHAKDNVVEMVREIRKQLNKTLKAIDWMDETTTNNALTKAAAISEYVAYPNELLNETKLRQAREEDLEFTDDEYMENFLNLYLFGMNGAFRGFREPIDKIDWMAHTKVAVINAFYDRFENSIELPAGILQGIMFDENLPKYMNYGAVGSIIGHELTHGFDGMGRQFDKHGNFETWWTPATDEEYRSRAMCFFNQYDNYVQERIDRRVNGFNTLDENIADNGGTKLAYSAYINWLDKNGNEPMLPKLPFNSRQLFWISTANVWCTKSRVEHDLYSIDNDDHSPAMFRVIGPLSNNDAFARDFNCSAQSRMNPPFKCSLW